MLSNSDTSQSFLLDRPSLRGRATSLLLAVSITLLILLGFLGLNGTSHQRPIFKGGPLMIALKSAEDAAPDRSKSTRESAKSQPRPNQARPKPPPMPVQKPPPIETNRPSPYILLTKEEYQKFDFKKLGSAGAAARAEAAQQQASAGGGDSRAVGNAPNGEPLYEAEWYRRPTHAELSAYLPPSMPASGGSGLIACRTVARYHVDDCVELGSAPPGSRLAGAVRQAAWQFLVRPPRKGGKELVGTWVRIRIDYSVTGGGGSSAEIQEQNRHATAYGPHL